MHDHTFVLKTGWRTTYTDKHGRTTVTGKGPDRVGSHKGRNTLHPTLFRRRIRNKQLTQENVHTVLADKPGSTVDVHLLRLITKHIPTQLLLSEVAGHPACARADKLADIMYIEPPDAQHRYCIWDAHTICVTDHPTYADAISRHLQYNTAPLLIISQDTTITGMQQQVTIDTNTIQVNTGKFWQGNQKGSSRTTNQETLYIHMSPVCTPQEVITISLLTRLRHVSTYAHEPTPPIPSSLSPLPPLHTHSAYGRSRLDLCQLSSHHHGRHLLTLSTPSKTANLPSLVPRP